MILRKRMTNINRCSICMDEIEDATTLPCGHTFHGKCLSTWLWTQQSCPNCRMQPEETNVTERNAEIADNSSLRTLIRSIHEQHQNMQNTFTRNARRARQPGACSILKQNYASYTRWRVQVREDRADLKRVERSIKQEDAKLREEQRNLHSEYVKKYRENIARHRTVCTPLRIEQRKRRGTLHRHDRRCTYYRNLLATTTYD